MATGKMTYPGVRERKGRYYVRYRVRDEKGEIKQKERVAGNDFMAAIELKQKLEAEKEIAMNLSPNTLYYEYIEWWKNNVLTQNQRKTQERYTKDLKNVILPFFGYYKLRDITPVKITEFFNYMRNIKQYKSSTIKCIYGVFQKSIHDAYIQGIIVNNPLFRVQRPKLPDDAERKYLDYEQLEIVLKYFYDNDPTYYLLFFTDACLGLRMQEILALSWDDIDFIKRRITITHTLQVLHTNSLDMSSNTETIYSTVQKTNATRRTLTLPDVLYQLLCEEYKRYQAKQAEVGYNNPNNLIFVDEEGNAIGEEKLKYRIRKCKSKTGIDFSSHSFRHTLASMLFHNKVGLVEISKRLGHAKTSTTANIYGHLMVPELAESREVIDNVLSNIHNSGEKE